MGLAKRTIITPTSESGWRIYIHTKKGKLCMKFEFTGRCAVNVDAAIPLVFGGYMLPPIVYQLTALCKEVSPLFPCLAGSVLVVLMCLQLHKCYQYKILQVSTWEVCNTVTVRPVFLGEEFRNIFPESRSSGNGQSRGFRS